MDASNLEFGSQRRDPTGEPVVRGDPSVAGSRAESAIEFDPSDPESLETATGIVREFAGQVDELSPFDILCGAAACATLVRGGDSYQAASERAGEGVSINFLRTWTRVHDLPIEIRRLIALADIVPSAAQHITRVDGQDRYFLAWAIVDHDLTVREVRSIVSEVRNGTSMQTALEGHDALPGRTEITLPLELYHEARLEATRRVQDLEEVLAEALREWLADSEREPT